MMETRGRKIKNWVEDLNQPLNYYVVYSVLVLLFFGGMTIAFAYYGKAFLWTADGISQHYPNLIYIRSWIREFVSNIIYEHTWKVPMWDMTLGFGQDFLNAFSFRPLYILYAFFPDGSIEVFLALRIIISLYLCGFFFSQYIRSFHWDGYACLVGSLVYTFSGFSIYFACRHTFFLELMIYLPLMFLGLEHILKERKPWLFLAVTAICGISYFYFLYMIMIPAFVYACIRYFYIERKHGVLDFLKCVLYTGLIFGWGIAIAAFSFWPGVLRFLHSNRGGGSGFISYLHFNWQYYRQLLTGILSMNEIGTYGFMGFSGIVILCLCVLLFQRDKIARQIKIGILAGCLIFCIPFLVFAFNGFSGKTNRWTYAFAFVMAVAVAYTLPRLFTLHKPEWKRLGILVCIFTLVEGCIYIVSGEKPEYSYLLLVIGTVLLYAGNGILKRYPCKARAFLLAFLLVDVSVMSWSLYSVSGQNYISTFVDAGSVEAESDNSSITMMENNTDSSIFRLDVIFPSYAVKQRYKNYGLRSGYNGLNSYFSFSDSRVTHYASDLGDSQQNVPFLILDFDQRTALDTLAGVKYITVAESEVAQVPYGYVAVDQQEKTYLDGTTETVYLYVNQYYLPIMYTYDSYIPKEQYDAYTANEKEQAMLQGIVLDQNVENYPQTDVKFTEQIVLKNQELLDQMKENSNPDVIEVQENGILVKKDSSAVTISYRGRGNAETYLLWKNVLYQNLTKQQEKQIALGENYTRYEEKNYKETHITDEENLSSAIVVTSGDVTKTAPLVSSAHQYYWGAKDLLVNLGYTEKQNKSMTIRFTKAGFYSFDEVQVICQPMNQYVNQVAKLAEDPVEDITIDCNTVTAHTTLSKDKILCIAIPYSDDWSATVNGEPVEVLEGNGMYMALPLKAGENEIELNYETPGIRSGIAISLLSLGILILVLGIPAWWKTVQKLRRRHYHS